MDKVVKHFGVLGMHWGRRKGPSKYPAFPKRGETKYRAFPKRQPTKHPAIPEKAKQTLRKKYSLLTGDPNISTGKKVAVGALAIVGAMAIAKYA